MPQMPHTSINMDESRIYAALGTLVRQHREGQGMSQLSLARRVDLSRASIANIELGRQRIPLHHVYRLADALGVNPHTLLPDLTAIPSQAVSRGINSSMSLNAREQADVAKVLSALHSEAGRKK